MNNYVIAPDSFKGSLSSIEVCDIIKEQILTYHPHAQVHTIPLADGGEGTLDVLAQNMLGWILKAQVNDPLGRIVTAQYLQTATAYIIEIAQIVGLPLMADNLDIGAATTFGVGQLIAQALEEEIPQIILTLGGSATQDGGCGMAAALGYVFLDKFNRAFIPTAATLLNIDRIIPPAAKYRQQIDSTEIIAMCDVTNPLYGKNGASYVFGPQKGARPEDIPFYDEGLAHLARIIQRDLHISVDNIPGGGAAGGLGAGAVAFLGARLQSGIKTILDLVHFERLIDDETVIITGEGKLDTQSFQGKVLSGLLPKASYAGCNIVVFAGKVELDATSSSIPDFISDIIEITPQHQSTATAMKLARENLERAAGEYFSTH